MTDTFQFGPVEFIKGAKKGRYPYCNSLFIKDAGVLIDPASDKQRLVEIRDAVTAVWLSHWHEDHIKYLYQFEHVPLWLHEADAPPLTDIEVFIQWYYPNGMANQHLSDNWRKMLTKVFNFSPRKADHTFKGGEVIDLGSVTVEIIHAPGHSPGNLAFLFREPEILFLGDNDLTPFGPWYGDRYSDIDQIIDSVKKLREIPVRTWLTGHEHGIFEENPGQVWDDYLGVINQREQKLFDFLAEPRSLDDITQAWIVYRKPREPLAEFEMMERISMKKHADRLIRQGLVTFEEGKYHRR